MSARGLLSAEDLQLLVRPVDSGLPQRAGVKDYAPDGSWLEGKRLQTYYDDQHRLLSEERVKKVGSLARGEWQPNLGKVLVAKEVGKFWSHFGHMDGGKKMLYPEEAMFLLDECQMEIYYGGLPLSLQEAYATLLGTTVPLEHYQVFAHLARLGYTLRRHEAVPMVTDYERKIHLDKHQIKKSKKQRKRPRIPTPKEPSSTPDDPEKEDVSSVKKPKTEEELSENCAKQTDKQCVEKQPTDLDGNSINSGATLRLEEQTCGLSSGSTWCDMDTSNAADSKIEFNTVGMYLNNCITGNAANISKSASATSIQHVPYSNWDFSSIVFPDFPHGKSSVELRALAPELLPNDIQCNDRIVECHKVGRISRQLMDGGSDTSRGHSLKSRTQNWGEYKEGLAGLSMDEKLLLCTPAPSLWKGDVTPLVKPHQATSTDAVLEKLKLSQNVDVTRFDIKTHDNKDVFPKIVYDVFLPDSKFKKSDPGQPDHRIFVVRQEDPPPSLSQIRELSCQSSDGVPLNWAVVDSGDIAFYSFNLVDLPRDTTFL